MSVSVVICCHNSAHRLEKTLQHLLNQRNIQGISWEVIVVDNCSTDHTADVARRTWTENTIPLRVVDEPKLGLSYARERGIKAARHEFVSFIDDDNWVKPEWIATVERAMHDNPNAAVIGGPSKGVFESAPPDWFNPEWFAIGPQAKARGDITQTHGCVWGAGLNLRKAAYVKLRHDGFIPLLADRSGSQLSSGGDIELCLALKLAGWRIYYEPDLVLEHFMPKGRLTWEYARKFQRTLAAGSVVIDEYLNAFDEASGGRKVKPWLYRVLGSLKRLVKNTLRIGLHGTREGYFAVLNWEFELGRMESLMRNRKSINRWRRAINEGQWNISTNKPAPFGGNARELE